MSFEPLRFLRIAESETVAQQHCHSSTAPTASPAKPAHLPARRAEIGGIPLAELNSLELEFLFALDFDLALPPAVYSSTTHRLLLCPATAAADGPRHHPARPADHDTVESQAGSAATSAAIAAMRMGEEWSTSCSEHAATTTVCGGRAVGKGTAAGSSPAPSGPASESPPCGPGQRPQHEAGRLVTHAAVRQ